MLLDPFLKSQPARYRHEIENCEAFYWIYLREGRLWVEHLNQRERLGPGHLLVMPVGTKVNLWTESGKGYRGVSFTVLPSTALRWSGNKARVFGNAPVIGQLAEILADSLTGTRTMKFCRLLSNALLEETRLLFEEKEKRDSPSVRETAPTAIADAIKRNVYGGEKIEAILSRSGFSVRQAERLFKNRFGVSAKTYLMRLRLEQAKCWLAERNISVVSAARELGFSTAAHFSLWFKKETGLAPAHWRARNG